MFLTNTTPHKTKRKLKFKKKPHKIPQNPPPPPPPPLPQLVHLEKNLQSIEHPHTAITTNIATHQQTPNSHIVDELTFFAMTLNLN
jgi:hypothetical protein